MITLAANHQNNWHVSHRYGPGGTSPRVIFLSSGEHARLGRCFRRLAERVIDPAQFQPSAKPPRDALRSPHAFSSALVFLLTGSGDFQVADFRRLPLLFADLLSLPAPTAPLSPATSPGVDGHARLSQAWAKVNSPGPEFGSSRAVFARLQNVWAAPSGRVGRDAQKQDSDKAMMSRHSWHQRRY